MSTALALKEATDIVITNEQIDIIKNTVCREATDAEMQLYFYDCKRRGVHPLDRLIHFTKRGGRYVPITSIDLFYQRAHASGEFAGQDETIFKGQPGRDGFEATVRVYRQRQGHDKAGWSATARWSEYFPGEQQGHMWKKMPSRMLEKCAEALALRKAFPSELQGLYVKEEMDKAGEELPAYRQRSTPQEPKPDKGQAVLDKLKKNGNGHQPEAQGTGHAVDAHSSNEADYTPQASDSAPAPSDADDLEQRAIDDYCRLFREVTTPQACNKLYQEAPANLKSAIYPTYSKTLKEINEKLKELNKKR